MGHGRRWLLFLLLALASCRERPPVARPATATSSVRLPADATLPPPPSASATATVTAAPPSSTIPPLTASTPPTAAATPELIPPAVVEVEGAVLPPGFSMIRFADFYRPTGLAFDPAGRLYATSFDGTVRLLADTNGDGRADVNSVFYRGLNLPLGVTVHPDGGSVYVSSTGRITVLGDNDGDLVADETVTLVSGLPHGLHMNDNLKFGPDGLLYIGVGSTCDACVEGDPRSGTIMRFDPATGIGEVFARGLRNPYDLAFHPGNGDLFATDNGRDDLGLDAPQEELNHITAGGHYGWPGCWDLLVGPNCSGTTPAVAFFEARSSANSLDFYTGNRFPALYWGQLFVAVFGSFEKPGVQRGVAVVRLTPGDQTYQGQVSWFSQWDGMPLGLITGPDGALYVGDYIKGGIYRISYGP